MLDYPSDDAFFGIEDLAGNLFLSGSYGYFEAQFVGNRIM